LSSLLLLGVALEESLVVTASLLGSLDSGDLVSLDDVLSAESLLSHHTLDSGGLVEGLVTLLNFTVNDIAFDIILLFEVEVLDDSVLSLLSESVGVLNIGESGNFLFTLGDNSEGDDGKIGTGNATTDGLSLALTSSSGLEGSSTLSEENSGSAVDKDTLLHGETLFVVSSGDSEDVTLVFISHKLSVDFLTHASVKEGTNVFFIINFDFLVATSGGVTQIKLYKK